MIPCWTLVTVSTVPATEPLNLTSNPFSKLVPNRLIRSGDMITKFGFAGSGTRFCLPTITSVLSGSTSSRNARSEVSASDWVGASAATDGMASPIKYDIEQRRAAGGEKPDGRQRTWIEHSAAGA